MPARRRGDAGADTGAAAVDFVLLSVLLVMLLLGVLQVAVYFYARNVVAASAADAARYAAAEGIDARDGGARAERLVLAGLDKADAQSVHCTGASGRDPVTGLATATVRCTGHLRLLFLPLELPLTVDVRSSALKEGW
jgi:Flp pilus assembly protein TadG